MRSRQILQATRVRPNQDQAQLQPRPNAVLPQQSIPSPTTWASTIQSRKFEQIEFWGGDPLKLCRQSLFAGRSAWLRLLALLGWLVFAPARADAYAETEIRVPVTRDTWFSNVGTEADGNNGGATRLKLKSLQEMALIDIDPTPLRGHVIQSAQLHVRLAAEPQLLRVTVGSFGAEWVEGTASGYAQEQGSSTHNRRRHPDGLWAGPGSDLCSVILGQGGTLWRMADATPADPQRWQTVAIGPAVLAARVAGISYGLFLYDDTGSEWTRKGETFTPRPMPNRFIQSREAGPANAPYLTVTLGAPDKESPGAPQDLKFDPADLPAGEVWVSWITPEDRGPAGTAGFFARVGTHEVPRSLIPLARAPGQRVQVHLRDLPLSAGAEIPFSVQAVDGAGNLGPMAMTMIRVSSRVARPLPGTAPQPFIGRSPLPRLGTAQVAIVDELDKLQPETNELIPSQPAGYLSGNHLWEAGSRQIRLHAARNEFVGFQIVVRGTPTVRPSLTFGPPGPGAIQVEFGRYHHVATPRGPLPDPIVPLGGPAVNVVNFGRQGGSLHCDLFVPHAATAGEHRGTLVLEAGGNSLTLDLILTVWDFTLPDYLSFLPEMNCYDLPGNERAFYRLAHRHRTVLNKVPYGHSGVVTAGCAPAWNGRSLDWSAWDRRFGPYFDGSAFTDLPRRGVPLECFYLPLHENWPDPMEGNYNGDYWADRAFPATYRRDFVAVSRQMAEHFNARGWNETFFQFYLNGKTNFKTRGWSRGTSPWLLDEPAHFQDYWALCYFGSAFHAGIDPVQGRAKLVFRCDISRPQWQRDALDGLLDYNVVGSAIHPYARLVADRQAVDGSVVVEYGGTNAVDQANVQPAGWCLDTWSRGWNGVLPWQTIGTRESWSSGDPLALFYPSPGETEGDPIPSIRLKSYRRGQQDVEYLTLLALTEGEPRWAVGQQVRATLRLAAERQGTSTNGAEDAGLIQYNNLSPQALWALRIRVGQTLSKQRLAPRRKIVELRVPNRTQKSPGAQ